MVVPRRHKECVGAEAVLEAEAKQLAEKVLISGQVATAQVQMAEMGAGR